MATKVEKMVEELKHSHGKWVIVLEAENLERCKVLEKSLRKRGYNVTRKKDGDSYTVYARSV